MSTMCVTAHTHHMFPCVFINVYWYEYVLPLSQHKHSSCLLVFTLIMWRYEYMCCTCRYSTQHQQNTTPTRTHVCTLGARFAQPEGNNRTNKTDVVKTVENFQVQEGPTYTYVCIMYTHSSQGGGVF